MVKNRLKVKNSLEICRIQYSVKYEELIEYRNREIIYIKPENLLLDKKQDRYLLSVKEYVKNILKIDFKSLSEKVKKELEKIVFQKILKENKHCRINLSIGSFHSTEIFTKDVFNGEYPWKL